MPIYLIDKIKQKNNGTFKLVESGDIEWNSKIPEKNMPDDYANLTTIKTEIANQISAAPHIKRTIVNDLPISNIDSNTIYMKSNGATDENIYDEYMYINGSWEIIGTSKAQLDKYLTKDEAKDTYVTIATIEDPKTGYVLHTTYDAYVQSNNLAVNQNKQNITKNEQDITSIKNNYLPKSGGTMSGSITMGADYTPSGNKDVTTKEYVASAIKDQSAADGKTYLVPGDISNGSELGQFIINKNGVQTVITVGGLASAASKSEDYFVKSDDFTWHAIS